MAESPVRILSMKDTASETASCPHASNPSWLQEAERECRDGTRNSPPRGRSRVLIGNKEGSSLASIRCCWPHLLLMWPMGPVAREGQLSIQVRLGPTHGKPDSRSQLLVVASHPRRGLPQASPHMFGCRF